MPPSGRLAGRAGGRPSRLAAAASPRATRRGHSLPVTGRLCCVSYRPVAGAYSAACKPSTCALLRFVQARRRPRCGRRCRAARVERPRRRQDAHQRADPGQEDTPPLQAPCRKRRARGAGYRQRAGQSASGEGPGRVRERRGPVRGARVRAARRAAARVRRPCDEGAAAAHFRRLAAACPFKSQAEHRTTARASCARTPARASHAPAPQSWRRGHFLPPCPIPVVENVPAVRQPAGGGKWRGGRPTVSTSGAHLGL